jgi:hypothetical protein
MEVEGGHLTTINALPQVLGRQRTALEVLGMTTATRIATQIPRQTRPLPRV